MAISDGRLAANPVKGVRFFAEPTGLLRFLSDAEISTLRDRLSPEYWSIVAFSLETGLRLTEQFHARWDCLNTEQGILTIPLSKSGKTRHVILTDSVLAITRGLSSWSHSPFLFPSPLASVQPMQGRNFVVKVYEPALKRTKIEGGYLAHLAAYLRVSGCNGWSRYPNGSGIDGPFHDHNDHAICPSLARSFAKCGK